MITASNEELLKEVKRRGLSLKLKPGRKPGTGRVTVLRRCVCGAEVNGKQWYEHAPRCARLLEGVVIIQGTPNKRPRGRFIKLPSEAASPLPFESKVG